MPLQSNLVVFGEVLFDCFPDGRRVLGGAPFNVAWGLQGFGHAPLFVSAVGDDADGAQIRSRMAEWGMRQEALQTHPSLATGDVQIELHDGDARYEICEPRAWDAIEDCGIEASGWLYHGVLALRDDVSRSCFEALVQRSRPRRFFDVNLRPPYDSLDQVRHWMTGVDWLKLNDDELAQLLGREAIDFSDCSASVQQLRETYGIRNVLLTGGSQGARLIGEVGEFACLPAPKPRELVDTVGAGDSLAAFTLHGILTGMPVEAILPKACGFAAQVCGMTGATTTDRDFYRSV